MNKNGNTKINQINIDNVPAILIILNLLLSVKYIGKQIILSNTNSTIFITIGF